MKKKRVKKGFLLMQMIEEGNVYPPNLMRSAAPFTDPIPMYNAQFKGDNNTEGK